ncbi:MAG TPA: hypothetical protein V6D26_14525 [Stenomitos sp.]
MNKTQVMDKFGFTNADDFDALLLDLAIDPEAEELTDAEVETVKNHVTVFATSLTALPEAQEPDNGNGNGHQTYIPPVGAMSVITNQGLQLAKETGLQISQGALETLSQLTFDKGRLDAAFLENAYWLGLLRQQNQLRAANTEKFIQLLQAQQNTNLDIEKLATDAGLVSNEELVKKLSTAASVGTERTNLNDAVATATAW